MKNWNYWDSKIIKGPDGRYHMFASRWAQSTGHNNWWNSQAVSAVSNSLLGPYIDQGLIWPNDEGGRGHNVTAVTMPDGRYAVIISETRPGTVFVSQSLDGPWTRWESSRSPIINTRPWERLPTCPCWSAPMAILRLYHAPAPSSSARPASWGRTPFKDQAFIRR